MRLNHNIMSEPAKIHSHNIGKISTVLSILCAIHCIATPILALFLPFLDTHSADWVEIALILFILILGGSSIYHGYKGHHGKILPSVLFATGLLFLIIGYIIHGSENQTFHTALMITGSLFSAGGQIYNLKLSHMDKPTVAQEL